MIDAAGLTRSQDQAVKLVNGVAAAVLASLIVAALYFGREVFLPMALAMLLVDTVSACIGDGDNRHA